MNCGMHPDDVGKVIGRQGMTINAMRSLLAGGQRQEIVALLPGNRRGQASGISLKIDVLTLFPEMFTGPMDVSIVQRARKNGLLDLRVHNLRDYTHDNYKTVDDRPFGGGPGMVLKPEPIFEAVEALAGREDAGHFDESGGADVWPGRRPGNWRGRKSCSLFAAPTRAWTNGCARSWWMTNCPSAIMC